MLASPHAGHNQNDTYHPCLCEIRFTNFALNFEQDGSLPVVKAHHLVEFYHCTSEGLWVSTVNSLNQRIGKFGLSR
jgi:hypothetical protein